MPQGMWLLFAGSFRRNLASLFWFDKEERKLMTKNAKKKYKDIVNSLPEFEKGDRFKVNILSCAQFASFYLQLPAKPSVEISTEYYNKSMMTGTMKLFCRISGKRKFSRKDIEGMKKIEQVRAADRNP